LGALVPDDARKELVQLLALHDVPLIEDDVYAELYFGSRRPTSSKAFDQKGMVLNCGSFSKSLAPGYRIGWVAAGRFARAVGRRKVMSSLSSNIPAQDAIAQYLRQGGYDRHLGALRRTFAAQQKSALQALRAHIPPGFTVTQPLGANLPTVCVSITAMNGLRRASGPSRPLGPSCDHSVGGGVRLGLSFIG